MSIRFTKRVLLTIVVVLLLAFGSILIFQKKYSFVYNTTISYLKFLVPIRISNVCSHVLSSDVENCKKNPQSLLVQSAGKSSSLSTLRIANSPISKTDKLVFAYSNVADWETSIPINWNSGPFKNRSWQMSLESWRLLDGYLHEYGKTGDPLNLQICMRILSDWYDFHIKKTKFSKFAWNDMSTAYRADRLSKILDWMSKATWASSSDILLLLTLAKLHVDYLSDPDNLNSDNHGVFEIAGLARLCKAASYLKRCSQIQDWLVQSSDRLTKNQFGRDGLQLEHSFEYHVWMDGIYDNLMSEGIFPLSEQSKSLFLKSKENKKWLYSPKGKLLPIGDSFEHPLKPKEFAEDFFDQQKMKILPYDGLAMVRGKENGLWFYAFHHSSSHKHDDDLAFYLWDKGEPLLIDAGKYGYVNNEKREYVYSRAAHNTILVPKLKSTRSYKPYDSGIRSLTKITDGYLAQGNVVFENGINLSRELKYIPGKQLIVNDHVDARDGEIGVNFLISPTFDKVSQDGNQIVFASKTVKMIISNTTPHCKVETYRGFHEGSNMRGWYSPSYGKLQPTWNITYVCPSTEEIVTKIDY